MSERILFQETLILIGIASLVGGLALFMSRIENFIPYLAVALVFTLPVFSFIKNKLMKANGHEVDEKGFSLMSIVKNPLTILVLVVTSITGIVDASIIIKTFLFVLVANLSLKTLSTMFNKVKSIEVPSNKIKMPEFNTNLAFGAKKKKDNNS